MELSVTAALPARGLGWEADEGPGPTDSGPDDAESAPRSCQANRPLGFGGASLASLPSRGSVLPRDRSAQFSDADQVAGRITKGAVADPIRLLKRLLDHFGAARL